MPRTDYLTVILFDINKVKDLKNSFKLLNQFLTVLTNSYRAVMLGWYSLTYTTSQMIKSFRPGDCFFYITLCLGTWSRPLPSSTKFEISKGQFKKIYIYIRNVIDVILSWDLANLALWSTMGSQTSIEEHYPEKVSSHTQNSVRFYFVYLMHKGTVPTAYYVLLYCRVFRGRYLSVHDACSAGVLSHVVLYCVC